MNEKIELYKIRDVGQTMGFAIALIRRHYKHMFKTIGLMTIPLVLAASTLYFLGTTQQISDVQALGNNQFRTPGSFINGQLILAILISFLTYIAILWGCVYYVKLYDEKGPENFTWNDIWNQVFEHGWRLIFAIMLMGIIFFIVAIILTLVMGALVSIGPFMMVIILPLVFVGFIMFFILQITWMIVYLFERKPMFDAWSEARRLLSNRWWKGLAILFFSYLIIYGIFVIPSISLQLIPILRSLGIEVPFSVNSPYFLMIYQNISTVLGFLTTFFIAMSYTGFYLTNKERNDNISLKRRVAQLAETPDLSTYS